MTNDYKPQSAMDGGSPEINNGMNKLAVGQELNLTKKDPTLKNAMVGMGWDLRGFEASPPDLDMCVFLLDKDDQTREDEDFIFYNNKMGAGGNVRHLGDSRTGAGDGDDEQVEIDLATLPFAIVKISFVLSLYTLDMGTEGHNFSMVRNVYFRLVNLDTSHEMFRVEIGEDLLSTGENAILCGELERVGSEWLFHAKVKPLQGGLSKIATDYGIMVVQNMQI